MVGPCLVLQQVLAHLKALAWVHWTCHWQVQGDPFYGDHQLFERLYDALPDSIDALAEKIVFLYGRDAVDPIILEELSLQVLKKNLSSKSLYLKALSMEKSLQTLLNSAYKNLKSNNNLSLGMDDFIMSLANKHETHQYLLKQRLVSPLVP
jgi:DNA-binding ferritin-like protein